MSAAPAPPEPTRAAAATIEILVAGGGLAGAAAACWLAQAGRQVVLIEREPVCGDKVCGEFLSAEAQHYLHGLGLDLHALGAQPIERLRLVRGARQVALELPFRGLSLSRRVLDDALLRRAVQCGAEVRRGQHIGAATPVAAPGTPGAARWRIELSGQAPAYAATLFLATGKHDVRTPKRAPRTPPEDLVGFKSYFALAPAQHAALRNHVEVLMFEHGYAGLQHVEGGRANLCLLAQRAWLQQHGANWDGLLRALLCASPHLRERLDGAQALLERALAIYRVPYGYVHRADVAAPHGLYRLGDQVGVIPSFSGDGMSIALHSAARAVQAYLDGAGAPAYHRRIERDLGGQIGRAMLLYRLARRAPGQALLMSAARRWPAALRWAAARTRVAPGLLLTYPECPTLPTLPTPPTQPAPP